MNDDDIKEFITAFKDFMKHSEEAIVDYNRNQEYERYCKDLYKKEASKLGISTEYYMLEFL